jgi:hypothetical protein
VGSFGSLMAPLTRRQSYWFHPIVWRSQQRLMQKQSARLTMEAWRKVSTPGSQAKGNHPIPRAIKARQLTIKKGEI